MGRKISPMKKIFGKKKTRRIITVVVLAVLTAVFAENEKGGKKMGRAIFAGGCFWGVEAFFQQLDEVVDTTVGYIGGHTRNPTYEEVCRHNTGHAEAVEVIYDSSRISYENLLRYFWRIHDPTTLNRQGPDMGDQYRSAVFYLNPEQKAAAEKVKREMQKYWENPIVTEIVPAGTFYPAEKYHQDYFKKHGARGCHYLRK